MKRKLNKKIIRQDLNVIALISIVVGGAVTIVALLWYFVFYLSAGLYILLAAITTMSIYFIITERYYPEIKQQ